ncbi:hypothetical protein HDV05_004306 [Chytridiales sp. JEL 0842]|nr:hypothetical protein HDV05_004306 [Chytridiales sp. JEL 0842]
MVAIRRRTYNQVVMRLLEFSQLLSMNPSLGPLVKELEIKVTRLDEDEEDSIEEGSSQFDGDANDISLSKLQPDEPAERGRVIHDEHLAYTIMKALSNLESVHVQIYPYFMYTGLLRSEAPTIVHLDLSGGGISEEHLIKIGSTFCNLQELFLRDCSDIEPETFQYMISHLPYLRVIGINGCEKLGDASLWALSQHCKQLEAIAFGYRQTVTGVSLKCFTQCTQKLKALFLDGHDAISEEPVVEVVKFHGETLNTLSLSYCAVTDRLVDVLIEKCPRLEGLALNGCGAGLTDSSIERLMVVCKSLRLLELDENEAITENLQRKVHMQFGDDVPSITKEFRYYYKYMY